VAHAGDNIDLLSGAQTVTLSFDGTEIRQTGFDGPYTVTNLVFTSVDLGIPSQSVSDVLTTAAYSYIDFGKVYYAITGNAGLPGAELRYTDGSPGTALADENGNYVIVVPYHWSGTVRPYKMGYAFTTTSREYTDLESDQVDQDYTAEALTYTVSGNTGLGGVTLTYIAEGGEPETIVSDDQGNYSLTLPFGWYGTITPSYPNYAFEPASIRHYLFGDQIGQDYMPLPVTHTISGNAGVPGAKLSYTDHVAKTTIADANGGYTLTVSYNWSGAVMPALPGYTFTPASRAYTNVSSDQTAQDYAAMLVGWVSAGTQHTCWLKSDGTLACWGSNNYGQSTPPSGTFMQVSAGGSHTCGLRSDGTLACWGDNGYGQAAPPDGTFTQVSAGGLHTCGLRSDGILACWGDNGYGQSTPPDGMFTQVSAGRFHTCGLRSDGTLACWGAGTGNTGATPDYGQSIPPDGTFTQVSAGLYHTCAIKSDSTLACWGWNSDGQSTSPDGSFIQVSAGSFHTCGLKSDSTLACWGSNTYGQSAPPEGTFTQVSAGYIHTCAIRNDGAPTCWGNNTWGQSAPLSISGNAGTPWALIGYEDNGPKTAVADSAGNYSFAVPYNWSGIVTPSARCSATFAPGSRSYSNMVSNQIAQNYTVGPVTCVISGYAGVAGATLSYNNGGPKTVTSDSSGRYTIVVPGGWSGAVTPSKTGFAFWPASMTYTSVWANQPDRNYWLSLTIASTAAQDGWVLESAANSGIGGSINATATTLRVGEDLVSRQYKSILSFNTASLPDNAVITTAIIDIAPYNSNTGISVLGNLFADIKSGSFGTAALQTTDFNGAASVTQVGTFFIVPNIGINPDPHAGWYRTGLTLAGLNNINKVGLTQFRLYFAPYAITGKTDLIQMFSSGEVAAATRPVLVIRYTLP
jgi:hypothetical protein